MANFQCGDVDIGVYGPNNKHYLVKCRAPGGETKCETVPAPPGPVPGMSEAQWVAHVGLHLAMADDNDMQDAAASGIRQGHYVISGGIAETQVGDMPSAEAAKHWPYRICGHAMCLRCARE